MRMIVNDNEVDSPGAMTVQALVATLTEARRGVAVAVNGTVVPRSAWADAALADGDRIEILTAAQGG